MLELLKTGNTQEKRMGRKENMGKWTVIFREKDISC
jgi:hypothetical protein